MQGGFWCARRQEESHCAARTEPFPATQQQQLRSHALPYVCVPICRVSAVAAPRLFDACACLVMFFAARCTAYSQLQQLQEGDEVAVDVTHPHHCRWFHGMA